MPSGELEFPEIAAVYARFAALMAMPPGPGHDLGGWLLLYSGLDRDGIAVAMAANVAGAASLGIEPDAGRAKRALRAGVCDFVVNNLDEALRILKNEIRKRRGVSVVLTADADTAVAQMVERGVQPEILTFPAQELTERGARVLARDVKDGLTMVSWRVASESARWLSDVDGLAAKSLKTTGARVRWLELAPRYLGRGFAEERHLRMTEGEADGFVRAIRDAVKTGAIPVGVSVTRGGETISIAP
jgi:Urocanase Rossmann-like domain